MHGIHSVLPPPGISNDPEDEPISVKKLWQGDGLWSRKKEIWVGCSIEYQNASAYQWKRWKNQSHTKNSPFWWIGKEPYWDPVKECVKNTSNKMISLALADANDLYWVVDNKPPLPASPKHKRVQLEEESLNNSVSTMKRALSAKKMNQIRKMQETSKESTTTTQSTF